MDIASGGNVHRILAYIASLPCSSFRASSGFSFGTSDATMPRPNEDGRDHAGRWRPRARHVLRTELLYAWPATIAQATDRFSPWHCRGQPPRPFFLHHFSDAC
ncbi:MAG: hypothetical protein Q6370_026180 [Candidatus Sigynarchaeota archaeon]